MERIKNFFKDESGASAVEYGLLVSLDRDGDPIVGGYCVWAQA